LRRHGVERFAKGRRVEVYTIEGSTVKARYRRVKSGSVLGEDPNEFLSDWESLPFPRQSSPQADSIDASQLQCRGRRTFTPQQAYPAAREMLVDVLPVPAFWDATTINVSLVRSRK